MEAFTGVGVSRAHTTVARAGDEDAANFSQRIHCVVVAEELRDGAVC